MLKLRYPDKYDWHGCEAVQFDPEKLSGRANVEGTRMFADGVLENHLAGLSVDEIIDCFGVRREAVEKILAFAAAKGFTQWSKSASSQKSEHLPALTRRSKA